MDTTTLHAYSAPWRRCIEFQLLDKAQRAVGTSVVMKKVEEGFHNEPTFTLPVQAAQTLMDDLWNCGLRPTEGSGSAGSLAATERHLADMRALVFKTPAPK